MPAILPFIPLALNTSTNTWWRSALERRPVESGIKCGHCGITQPRPTDGRCVACGAPLP